jgi:hypothetical protein
MNNITANSIDRRLLREQIKKKMFTEARHNLAQKVIEERYEKGITSLSIFDFASKEDIKEIINFAQENLNEVKYAARILREQVYSGQLTNSKHKVSQVLSNDIELKGQKIRLHEVSDFALDMLFGFGPMLGLIPLPGFEIAGSGIAIAGLLYYGYKLYQAVRAEDGLEIFIQGISVLFAAAAVFPRVGAAFAAAAKKVFDFFKGFIGVLGKGILAVKTGGVSVVSNVVAKFGKEAVEQGAKEVVEQGTVNAMKELGEQIITNNQTLKKGAEIASNGAKYLDHAIDLLRGMKEGAATKYLGKIPVIGPKISSVVDNLLEVLPKVRDIIIKNTKTIAEVSEVAVKEGVDEVGTGVLTTIAAATTQAEKKAAQETLEALAKESDELAAAARQLGYLDEAFETAAKATTKGKKGAKGIHKAGEKLLGEFDVVMSKMSQEAASIGKNASGDAIELVQREIFKAGEKLAGVGIKNKSTYASVTKIYKGLFQTAQDIAVISKTSISSAIKELPSAAKTINFGNLKITGQAVTKGGSKVVIKEIVEEEGKIMVRAVAKNGKVYAREMTGDIAKQLSDKGIFKSIFGKMNNNLGRQAKVLERRTLKASFSRTAAKEAEEASLKLADDITTQTVGEITEEVGQVAAKVTAENADSVIKTLISPEKLMKADWWVKLTGGLWNTFLSGLDVSGKTKLSRVVDSQSSDYYNVDRSELDETLRRKSLKFLY